MALYVVVAFHVRFMPLCFGSEVKLLYTLLYSHLVNKGILMDVNICLFIYSFIYLSPLTKQLSTNSRLLHNSQQP